jgi:Uma2 family endonuclease
MSTLLTRGAEGLDRRGFSLSEIEAMLEAGILDPDEKFELIDGEIVPMSPQSMPHMMVKARINRWLIPRLPAHFEMIPEGTLRISERPAMTFEPGLLIFEPTPGAKAILPAMVRLAIEVADSSRLKDLEIKAPRYGRAGVVELWVVDIPNRATVVHRTPGAKGYADIRTLAFEDTLSPLFDPALSLRLADVEP